MKKSKKFFLLLALIIPISSMAATDVAYCPTDANSKDTLTWQHVVPAGWRFATMPSNDQVLADTIDTLQAGEYTFGYAEYFQSSNAVVCHYSMKYNPQQPQAKNYFFQLEKLVTNIDGKIKFVPLTSSITGWRMTDKLSDEQRKYGAVPCYGEHVIATDCPFKNN